MRTIRRSGLVIFIISLVLHQAFAQWVQTKGPYGGSVNLVWAQGSTLFAAMDAGLYRSTDSGVNWVDPALTTTRVHAFLAVGTAILTGTDAGLYRTTDNGVTWSRPSTSLQTTGIHAFAVIGSRLYAGTDDGLYRSTDSGASWTLVKNFSSERVLALAVLPNAVGGTRLVVGTLLYPSGPWGEIYSTADDGTTWKQHTSLGGTLWVPDESGRTLLVSGTRLFARVHYYQAYNYIYTYYLNFNSDIDNWQNSPYLGHRFLAQSGILTGDLYMVDADGFFCRLDSTVTDATLQDNPAPTSLGFVGKEAQALARIPSSASIFFVAAADRGLWQSTDGAKTWTEANSGFINSNVRSLACLGTGTASSPAPIVAATSLLRGAQSNSFYGIYTSANQGTNWSAAANGPSDTIRCMTTFPIGTSAMAVVVGAKSGLYSSTDGGHRWMQLSAYSDVKGLSTSMVQGKPTLFAASGNAYDFRLHSLTDLVPGGLTMIYQISVGWGFTPASFQPTGVTSSLDANGNLVVYLYGEDGVDLSTDGGNNFRGLFRLHGERVNAIATSGGNVFLATTRGVYYNSLADAQAGKSWSVGLSGTKVNTLSVCGWRVFAGTDSLGVFFSPDDAATWYPVNNGLTTSRITSFAYDGANLYAGTQGGSVFRYTGTLGVDPTITPSASATVSSGSTFWVDVVAGNPDNVTDLWDFWFDLVSDNGACTYVDSSGTYGALMTQGFVPQIPRTVVSSAATTLVHFDIQRRSSSGVTGSGVIARAQFKAPPVPSGSSVDAPSATFSVKNLVGRNSKKERIYFHPSTMTVKFVKPSIKVWPGDCNADGVVNANDILPLGVYYLALDSDPDNQGILWQEYNRQPWTTDTPPKRIHADANGDRLVNSADLLAIGLNYGKTHSVSGVGSAYLDDPSLSKAESDGGLSITSVTREAGKLRANLRLSVSKPVYGIGFTLKYGLRGMSAETLRFIQVDTVQSVLGGGLIFSKPFDADGHADIAITRTDRVGFAGDGTLLNVSFEAPAGVEDALGLEVCQVVANDVNGNPISISGSVYQNNVTGVLDAVPLRNELHQNYPNPFNPSTLIRFEVSTKASVSLKIYDVLGRELAVLVNGILPAGTHSAVWDGSLHSSGVFFCVLRINEENKPMFVQTRRMTLVK